MPLLTLKSNGGGIVAMEFARSIVKIGWDITVLTSSYYETSASKLPENSDIRFLIVPSFGGKATSTALLLVCGFFYVLKNRPQLIYTHIATSLIPNFSDKKPVWLAQDIEYRFYRGRAKLAFKWILKRVSRKSDLLVTSNWLCKYFRRIGSKIAYAHDIGVSKKLFDNFSSLVKVERQNDVLIIAKHGAHKRGNESIILARYFSENGLRVILIDQMHDEQFSTVGRLRILGAVSQEQMIQRLAESKIFVSLSRAEGFGLVPLEALSVGCMVVTTPAPSIRECKSDRLRILTCNDSLIDGVKQAVHFFIRNPIDPRAELDGGIKFFLEDWAYHASKSLL
jgi:glycosyltransferase involved in cell wall biosynthesis